MLRDPVSLNTTYFREFGMHEVKNKYGDSDYIVSAPNWGEMAELIQSDLPKKGNVITPEYITVSHTLDELRRESRLISDRVKEAKALTEKSDAILHLGTPTKTHDDKGRPRWLNSVLSIQRGKVTSITHKTTLVPLEQEAGVIEPLSDLRHIQNGNAVLICAELYGLFIGNRQPKLLQQNNIKRIFAPTAWATPLVDNHITRTMHQEAGGEDNYYRKQLELVVGRYVMSLPTVNQVIVSDKGRADLPPYNAVFSRVGH